MDVTYTAERTNDARLSTEKSALAGNRDLVLATSIVIITDRGNYTASRTADDRSLMASSETSWTTEITSGTSSLNVASSTDRLQMESTGESSVRELKSSLAQKIIIPIGAVNPFTSSQTSVKTKTEDSSHLLNSTDVTTDTPSGDDSVRHSEQPLDVSETHVSEDTEQTSLLTNVAVRKGGATHVSMTHESTVSREFSKAPRSSFSTTLQKFFDTNALTVGDELTAEPDHGQLLSSRSHFTRVHKATTQLPASSDKDVDDNGFHTSGARDIMKTPVNSGNNVSFTNAMIVGIVVLGIFMTFVVTISLIVCRRRRKTDNLQTAHACIQNEKYLFPSKTCSVVMDYAECQEPSLQRVSMHEVDELFLLPNKQAMSDLSAGSSEGDSVFDDLDWLLHLDTDMSSLLQVVDDQLAENCRRPVASGDAAGCRSVETEQFDGQDSATASEDQSRHPACHGQSDDPVWQSFHEYDLVYVPHNDAASMARRVDNETSYVRTLQSQRNFSPYEEVCYGIRPLLLCGRHQQCPVVPPRTSSAHNSHLQNSSRNTMTVDCRDEGQTAGTSLQDELSHQSSTVLDAAVADDPCLVSPTE